MAVVYHDAVGKRFFIQAQNEDGSDFITFGPLSSHVFENIMQIMADIKDMDKRYNPLE